MSTPPGFLSPVWAGTEVADLTSDEALLAALLEVEAAWGEVLAEAGAAPRDSAAALRGIAMDPSGAGLSAERVAVAAAGGGNPVIPLLAELRSTLADRDASAAALHRGATSQDVLDSALVLITHRTARTILRDAAAAGDALSELAVTHRSTVCVARSLAQHALPTSFGLRVAGWLDGIGHAAARLQSALQGLPLQWGGAVGTQAALSDLVGPERAAELTETLSSRLQLPHAFRPWHTQRQPLLEVASALAGLLAALGKTAGDVLTLQRQEIAELREPAAAGRGGSSAMPQKRNPVLSTLIRSAALSGPQQLAGLHQAAAAAADERPDGAWHAEWPQLVELLRLTSGAAARSAELFSGLIVEPAAMQRNLGLTGAAVVGERILTRLSESFPGGRAGLQERMRRSAAEGASLRSLLREKLSTDQVTDAELDQVLDPADYLGRAGEFIDSAVADYTSARNRWS